MFLKSFLLLFFVTVLVLGVTSGGVISSMTNTYKCIFFKEKHTNYNAFSLGLFTEYVFHKEYLYQKQDVF